MPSLAAKRKQLQGRDYVARHKIICNINEVIEENIQSRGTEGKADNSHSLANRSISHDLLEAEHFVLIACLFVGVRRVGIWMV